MASIGKKIKDAGTKALKDKVSGSGKKDKHTEGSESGMDKAMRAAKNRLK
jgi:hypothetical protein